MKETITVPNDLEAEKFVLGACMTRWHCLDIVFDKLKAEFFSDLRHILIFKSIKAFYGSDKNPAVTDVASDLKKNGNLDKVGGFEYLKSIETISSGVNVSYYCNRIIEAYQRRATFFVTKDAFELCSKKDIPVKDTIEYCASKLMDINCVNIKKPKSFAEVFNEGINGKSFAEVFADKKRLLEEGLTVTDGPITGYKNLDSMLRGLAPGRLITLGARPSMGKTETLCQIIARMTKQGVNSMLFSMEMTAQEVASRLIGIWSGVHFSILESGCASSEEIMRVPDIIKIVGLSHCENLIIDEAVGITTDNIRARLRREVNRNGIQVAFIDHMGIIKPSHQNMKPYERMSEISRDLKRIAMELKICVFAAAQLNREVTKRNDPMPHMADLRDSGSIEQDSDQVLLLHRPDYYDVFDRPGVVIIKVDKNRFGPTGQIKFNYNANAASMEEDFGI